MPHIQALCFTISMLHWLSTFPIRRKLLPSEHCLAKSEVLTSAQASESHGGFLERAGWTLPCSSASVGPGMPGVGWCAGAMLPLLALNETLAYFPVLSLASSAVSHFSLL